ncbi:protease [Streptosporangium violaceochromogenes]|nr:protease [Streptosporangium violaceochromogenes]
MHVKVTSSRRELRGRVSALLAAAVGLGLIFPALTASPAAAAPPKPKPAPVKLFAADEDASDHVQKAPLKAKDRPPLSASKEELRHDFDEPQAPSKHPRPSMKGKLTAAQAKAKGLKGAAAKAAAAACSPSDFTSRSGSALVQQIKASTTDCINSLFSLKGSEAYYAFRESQMASVAYALRDNGSSYTGDNSGGTAQLVLYLRAGYFVHWYDTNVGTYGPTLKTAIQSGLDAFFNNSKAFTVSNANGEVLAEAITLIDSAEENDRYLDVVKRMLTGYNSSYDSSWWMLSAVNNVYTVLFRGHQVPAFVTKVQSDPSVLNTLNTFATSNIGLLSTDRSYLASNAGRELGRFLQHASMQAQVRPLAKNLLTSSSITGPTAPLWVGVAEMTDSFDKANCTYYDTCNLQQRLAASVLTVNYTCSSSIKIRAQDMNSTELADSCRSLTSQDAYFHSITKDNGPVANDYNTTIEVCVFNSSTDYQTYAGAMFGIDTNNGGMYLEGDPAASGNQPRFIAYEAEWVRPTFQIWNLNHEYTHYLDGRFNMFGDFGAGVTTPTIWWIEGFAEYISYSYRKEVYTAAMTEAANRTYALSTLWDTTYSHDTTRIYRWGYLAVRYMIENHPNDVATVLGYYRSGNWNGARSFLTSTIGSRYDSDWWTWLASCAAGSCNGGGGGGGGNQAPSASFSYNSNALAVSFSDTSSDADGTIASRSWNFGDGATSTAANPSHTYSAAGTYTVKLTVTDDGGATASSSQQVTVSTSGGGSNTPECTGGDARQLGQNCQRSNLSATAGNYYYLYLYVPAGTRQLTVTSSGGTGNADLYYSNSTWATTSSYTQRSTGATNSETLTISSPTAGYAYITLHASQAFSGVTVKAQY